MSGRPSEIPALDAEIADLEREVWRVAAKLANAIVHRNLVAAAENRSRFDPFELGGVGTAAKAPVPDRRLSSSTNGARSSKLILGPGAAERGIVLKLIDQAKLEKLSAGNSDGRRRAILMIAEMVEEAHPSGLGRTALRERIVGTGIVSPSVLSKCTTDMKKAGLIAYFRPKHLWFVADRGAPDERAAGELSMQPGGGSP